LVEILSIRFTFLFDRVRPRSPGLTWI